MKKLIATGLIMGMMLVFGRAFADEPYLESITLTAPSNSVLVWTNYNEPTTLYSIGISFGSAVTGNVTIGHYRGTNLYTISDFTASNTVSAIIECKRNWSLNNGDTINISVTNTAVAAQVILNIQYQRTRRW